MQKYSELLRKLLEKRGIMDEAKADTFLNPDYLKDMNDPFLMKDMERTCVRIFEAIKAKEKIIIYADYDCDGIPGAVILHDFFKKVGYENFDVYIPQRNSEGYGLNLEVIEQFAQSGTKLLITVDLGITAIAEVAQASIGSIDVIITDHHLPQENLPHAYAILNPKVDNYPEKMLCGAGVVFKLVQGFIKKYGEYFDKEGLEKNFCLGWEKWMLDMAGLATLSDMVPLVGENRAIAYFGMKVLRKSQRPGLQKLLAKINIDQKHITEDDIGFMVTPRLNAASRMDNPMRAYELLATSNEAEAGVLVNHLTKINDERKLIVAGIMREVKKNIGKRELKNVIVIGNPKWRVGVLGLVAGKMMNEYDKPVFVWGRDENDCIKGSCRSNGSISVVELMRATNEYFIDFGGHELAGGFTVCNDKVHLLEDALSEFWKTRSVSEKNMNDAFFAEIEVSDFSLVTMKNYHEIEKLAPFGLGNPKPIFLFKNVRIENIKKFGKNGLGEHLEIIFSDRNDKRINAISFFSNLESFSVLIEENKNVDLLATLDLSRFRGREELRLRIIDII